MITRQDIINKLVLYDIDPKVLKRYDEKHRFYHNIDHVLDLLNKAKEQNVLTDDLYLAIVFHDIIYSTNKFLYRFNEFRSARLFKRLFKNKLPESSVKRIYKAILSTRKHKIVNTLSLRLIKLDLTILYGPIDEFKTFEDNIRKEWEHIGNFKYHYNRLKILEGFNVDEDKIKYVFSNGFG